MKMAALANIEKWTADQVAEWLRGMDDVILPYGHFFLNNDVNGKKLLMLTHSDLDMINVTKLGHQELIMEAVDLLRSLHYELKTENLQSISLQLGCKAQCLYNELSKNDENNKNIGNMARNDTRAYLEVSTLTAVANIISTITHLVSWLDRSPFHTMYELTLQRNTIVKIGVDLVTATQRDPLRHNPISSIMQSCTLLCDICEEMVCNSQDPLIVQPAWLEHVTLRKNAGEELGMHIQSSYNGIHVVGGIKDMSPADLCGKIDKGDEVISVNYQIVVGWTLKKLVAMLKEKPNEVVLLVKKRPCHGNSQGVMGGNRHRKSPVTTLPKSLQKRWSREGDKPRPSLQDLGMLSDELTIRDCTDTDNEVFKSGSESPTLRLKVDPVKPRRATVSGGSPTLEHPSRISLDTSVESSEERTADSESFEGGDDITSVSSLRHHPSNFDYAGQRYLTVEPPLGMWGEAGMPSYTKHAELAGSMNKNHPKLIKVRRLSSLSDSDTSQPRKSSPSLSYSYSVVGGVVQKNVDRKAPLANEESPILRRHVRVEKRKLDRRVSCKDLGQGDCEGWLYRKKKRGGSGLLSNKWHKRWCILKHDNLYCYKQQDDQHAEGVIHLPSFKISPDELMTKGLTGSKKMFAFRVYNSGTGFYFASDRQEDMSKWMNKMGLASINYSPPASNNQLKVCYEAHDITASDSGDNSDRDHSPSRLSPSTSPIRQSPKHDRAASNDSDSKSSDDYSVLLRSIHNAHLTMDGVDRERRRTVTNSIQLTTQPDGELSKLKRLHALQRTMKDREEVVNEIDALLGGEVTSDKLSEFYRHHKHLFPHGTRCHRIGSNESTV